jgi:hypothetical protein
MLPNFRRWFKAAVTESFFRNRASAMPYRNVLGFLLGFIAALLLLTSWTSAEAKPISEAFAAWTFVALVILVFVLLIAVRPNEEGALDRFTWGVLALIVLGFGVGALTFHYRDHFEWVWLHYRLINTTSKIVLEVLFLLGVILGFFVVRNWGKEQKEFQENITAVLGGTFIAGILGKALGDEIKLIDAFALYGLGFTLSGTLNLIIAARLTAVYTNRRTITSRAILDFLYGSERARIIDGYFLKHFQEDPDYAKAWLVEMLIAYAAFTRRRFANRLNYRRKVKIADRTKQLKQPGFKDLEDLDKQLSKAREKLQAAQAEAERAALKKEIEDFEKQRLALERACRELREVNKALDETRIKWRAAATAEAEKSLLQGEINDLEQKRQNAEPLCLGLDALNKQLADAQALLQRVQTDAEKAAMQANIDALEKRRPPLDEACKQLPVINKQLTEAKEKIQAVANASSLPLWEDITRLETRRHKLEAQCKSDVQAATDQSGNGQRYYQLLTIESDAQGADNPPVAEADRKYTALYRPVDEISADMFRIGVSVRWQDTLEYIVAPGEYKGAFPLMGSVSGLSLLVRQTIVMDRDRFKQFRSKDYPQGIAPDKVEQKRGLDEIDFLSYISIPVVSRLGRSTENAVGILSLDTRLFLATDEDLAEVKQQREPGIYSSKLTRNKLTALASRLYEQNDKDIKYLEEITKIIVPVLELYLKCRVGAT